MENGIATRLRSLSDPGTSFDDVGGRSILKDAADEIERLIDLVGWAGKNWQETHSDLTKATRWISVEERLPEGDEPGAVLGWNGIRVREVVFCPRCKEGEQWSSFGGHEYVTHWMPLPEPPEVK